MWVEKYRELEPENLLKRISKLERELEDLKSRLPYKVFEPKKTYPTHD